MKSSTDMLRTIREAAAEESGFSLTELLIVAGLMVFVLGSAWFSMTAVNAMSDRIQAREQAASQSAIGIERITREMRQARKLADGTYAFKTTNSNRAVFYADLDHNTIPERITYYVNNGALYRVVATTTKFGPTDSDYGADSAPILIVPLDPSWTTVFTYYDNGSGDYSTFTSPTVVTTPADATAVQIVLRSKVTVGGATMTGTANTLINIRSTDTILDGS